MKQKKYTKRALCMSLLSMLLCCSMLIGTTFAWFTDSVTSGKNQIVAGNLDVELEYVTADDAKDGIDEDDWKPVKPDKSLFDDGTLWEPGHTEVVYLRISNKGTLALKYELAVTIAKETPGTVVDMTGEEKSFLLSTYLKFGHKNATEEPTPLSREEARTMAEAGTALGNALDSGKIAADGAPQYETLAICMPTTVGNEANYKTGTDAPTIELGIAVYATQDTVESDSFDNQYDADANLPNVFDTVELTDTLRKGGHVVLGSDATLFLDTTQGGGPGNPDTQTITEEETIKNDVDIDLNGYAMIAGVNQTHYATIADGWPMVYNANFSMKNGIYLMERQKIIQSTNNEAFAITFQMGEEGQKDQQNVTFENVIFENELRASQNAAIATDRLRPAVVICFRGHTQCTVTFKNCTFNDSYIEFTTGNLRNIGSVAPNIVFDNCTFNWTGNSSSKGVITGSLLKPNGTIVGTNIKIKDCTFNCTSTHSSGTKALDISGTNRIQWTFEGKNVLHGEEAVPHTADTEKGEWSGYDDIYVKTESPRDRLDGKPFATLCSLASLYLKYCTGVETISYTGRAYFDYPLPKS